MNASELKDFLKGDYEKIEKILVSLDCHKIWESSRGQEIRCASPEGDNKTAISVNMENLKVTYYSKGVNVKDIIGLVEHFKKYSFVEAMRYIKGILGVSGGKNYIAKVDHLSHLKKFASKKKTISLDELQVEKFETTILSNYVNLPHWNLVLESIMPQIQEQYGVCYDDRLDRIVFPHYAYDDITKIVGITGRTLASNEMIEEFEIPKYWNYIKGYMKTLNLYGFSHAIECVKECKKLVIFEAEKSVLKQATIEKGKAFSVSVGGHTLSDIQIMIIARLTPPDTEIVVAYDKDVLVNNHTNDLGEEISGEEYVKSICKRIARYRNVSFINDKYDLLGDKDSPIDKGIKIWNYLYKNRERVDF